MFRRTALFIIIKLQTKSLYCDCFFRKFNFYGILENVKKNYFVQISRDEFTTGPNSFYIHGTKSNIRKTKKTLEEQLAVII